MHNVVGVNVLFEWGVLEHGGIKRLAVAAGGWNDALIVEEGDRQERVQLHTEQF